jgi:5-methyltetrahydropteroyltriglutamate--homocysteine methyltransferase
MTQQILTTHVGSLPRPAHLNELNGRRTAGEAIDEDAYRQELRQAVADVVARQRDIGIDIVNDGECGHVMGVPYDFGAWWTYVFARLGGLELVSVAELAEALAPPPPPDGELRLATFLERRDWTQFSEAYGDPEAGVALPAVRDQVAFPVCRGPITYRGQEALANDIADMKAALDAAGLDDGFMNSVAPASCARFANQFYATDEELLYACADAMREEYTAIIDAGLMLQLDDPAIAENWDQIVPEPSVEAYQRFTRLRIEALNHAIRGLPPERIRFHLCWGSWHGPHVTDLPLRDIVDLMLEVNAGFYSFEAANARHEHEFVLWREIALPEGKTIMPGVVTHATNVVEHPELVAQRIRRFTDAVGAENVIASTDCGLGGRVHPQIAWAKLEALAQGAKLASDRLGVRS